MGRGGTIDGKGSGEEEGGGFRGKEAMVEEGLEEVMSTKQARGEMGDEESTRDTERKPIEARGRRSRGNWDVGEADTSLRRRGGAPRALSSRHT